MPRLSKIIPESLYDVKRESLLTILDFIEWLRKNKPEAYKEAKEIIGNKDCQDAFNELKKHTCWW
jgi:hypothetical protein